MIQGSHVYNSQINGGEPCQCHIDPFSWGQNPRTMFVAHMYLLNRHQELNPDIEKHDGFDALKQGCLIDVEYVLGMRDTPKLSECAR